jgi:adenylosuccinate lyase
MNTFQVSSHTAPFPNTLAERYASAEVTSIWSATGKIQLERDFWIALMKSQSLLGIDIPNEAITAYETVKSQVNLHSIAERERMLKHDVKARIEEFNALAGYEHIHKGMTSRDLTENVEQLQILRSLKVIRSKTLSLLVALTEKALTYKSLPLAARTHNVIAQPTTLGKRFANIAEELLWAYNRLTHLIENYPCRGVKGAIGSQQDQLTLFRNDQVKVVALEKALLDFLGFSNTFNNVGQVYPRSLDFDVVSVLNLLASAPSNFAKTLRLMAGHELASEGFGKDQVGSSAMPHKMNSRSAERIGGLSSVLKGHLVMASNLAGDQWNEGDVSCSVVRRVVLADSFFALDAILTTSLVILNQMTVHDEMISQELDRYAPFLATTTLLMAAVQKGMNREEAHKIIKQHALTSAQELRTGSETVNLLGKKLADDTAFTLLLDDVNVIIGDVKHLIGLSTNQIDQLATQIKAISSSDTSWEQYNGNSMEII